MATRFIVPRVDNEGGLGTSLKRWSEGHFISLKKNGKDVVASDTSIVAGNGLAGGGDLSSSKTLSIDFSRVNTWIGGQTFSTNFVGNGTANQLPNQLAGTPSAVMTRALSDARYLSSDDSFFVLEDRTSRFQPAAITGTGVTVEAQTLISEKATINITAAATTGSTGIWTPDSKVYDNYTNFSSYTGYFYITRLWTMVGNNATIRISLLGSYVDAQGAAPTARRVDLVITAPTTAHFECFNTSFSQSADFTIPDLSSNVTYPSLFIKMVIAGGVVTAYLMRSNTLASGVNFITLGSHNNTPTVLWGGRTGMGVHVSINGTSTSTRLLDLCRTAYRIKL